ncbi:MAG: glycosyltransferase family 2 protein [Pseudomonadota bacterium]
MAAIPVSAFIITKDEADRLPTALASLRDLVDEILVVDSHSTDGTVALAEAAGARVVVRDWPGYGAQKIYAEAACRHDWVLNLDADEALTPALADEIRALFADGAPRDAGFWLRRKMVHFADPGPRRLAPVDLWLRLYDRRRAGFRDSPVHDAVLVREGRTGRLRGLMLHHSFRSFSHFREKLDRYTSAQAADMVARGRVPPAWRAALERVGAFAKGYVAKGWWAFGIDGLRLAAHYAAARHARLVKARALARERGLLR